jgi:hypothetical protein
MKKHYLAIVAAFVLLGGLYFVYGYDSYVKQPVPASIDFTAIAEGKYFKKIPKKTVKPAAPVAPAIIPEETVEEIPAELNLTMPFYTQAPYANWDYPWQEACEEASILLVANEYLKKHWTKAQFNQQILDMVDWQNKRYGDYWHTTMAQTSEMLKEILGLDSVIHDNPSLDDMKRILMKGHFIVMPLDGKALKNPYFLNGGPLYHVLVVKGWTKENGIITNDVGTRRGEDYVYSWKVIESALHDYAVPMSKGVPRIIEVLPPVK